VNGVPAACPCRYETKVKKKKPPLATFLTLHPALFPSELYSDKAKE
jgi:hypothetical protein